MTQVDPGRNDLLLSLQFRLLPDFSFDWRKNIEIKNKNKNENEECDVEKK